VADISLDAPPRSALARLAASRWLPVVLFLTVAVVLYGVVAIIGDWVPQSDRVANSTTYYHGPSILEGWLRWDAGWYRSIVDHGYFFVHGQQSSVAFFPAYPISMEFLADTVGGDPSAWGVALTFASGLLVAVLFYQWCRDRIGATAAPVALAVMLLWPYGWYLFGAVYADALFLAMVLLAFTFLERDRVLLAALAGAVATSTRPVGAAVLLGLVFRLLERRGALRLPILDRVRLFRADRRAGAPPELADPNVDEERGSIVVEWRRLRPLDPLILLAASGLLAYVVYLWRTFDEPFAFADAESAPGWDQAPGFRTWFKTAWFSRLVHLPGDPNGYFVSITFQAILALTLLALIPLVVRRIGWGYGIYTLAVLAIPLVGSKDFMGIGRYALTAFPSFAALGLVLTERPRARAAWFPVSAFLLVALCGAFAYGHYVA
jgi:hypothetical protein